jgi:methylenetetrahydrofolate dehydrogenase (NADP+)/methenyltetrahydrofolate cyclohydrolase
VFVERKTHPILEDGVIHGRRAARLVRGEVKARVQALARRGVVPRLTFVRVGDDPASEVYVNAKARACGWVGIRSEHRHLPEGTTQEELSALVGELNRDDDVDGLLVQLPLPAHLSRQVLNRIDPSKDVDGFHPENLGAMLAGRGPLEPCTPAGVMRLIELLGLDLRGKSAVVVGRSVIVGRPMYNALVRAHATVTCCHRHTRNLRQIVTQADILVVATGVSGLIRGDWVKPGAYVFDVGITRGDDGLLRGDVCFEEALGRAAGVTPVPGGVGPMTIALLLENTVRCAMMRRGLESSTIERL